MKPRLLNKDKLHKYLENKYSHELEAIEPLLIAEYHVFPSQDKYILRIPDYNVESVIQFKKNDVIFKSCTCPLFSKVKHCVHLYWLMQKYKASAIASPVKALTPGNQKKSDREQSLAILIDKIPAHDLEGFVTDLALRDKNIALQLTNKFVAFLAEMEDSKLLEQHIQNLAQLLVQSKSSEPARADFSIFIQEYVLQIRISRLSKHYLSAYALTEVILQFLLEFLYNLPYEKQPQEELEVIEAEIILLAGDELSPDLTLKLKNEISRIVLSPWYLPAGARANFYQLPQIYLPPREALSELLIEKMVSWHDSHTAPYDLFNVYYFDAKREKAIPDWSMEQWSSMIIYAKAFPDKNQIVEATKAVFSDKIPKEIASTALEYLLSKIPESIYNAGLRQVFFTTWFQRQETAILHYIPADVSAVMCSEMLLIAESFDEYYAAAKFCNLTKNTATLEESISWDNALQVFACLPYCKDQFIKDHEEKAREVLFQFANDHIGRTNAEIMKTFLKSLMRPGFEKTVGKWIKELNTAYGSRPALSEELKSIKSER